MRIGKRRKEKRGNEWQFDTNHLPPFYLHEMDLNSFLLAIVPRRTTNTFQRELISPDESEEIVAQFFAGQTNSLAGWACERIKALFLNDRGGFFREKNKKLLSPTGKKADMSSQAWKMKEEEEHVRTIPLVRKMRARLSERKVISLCFFLSIQLFLFLRKTRKISDCRTAKGNRNCRHVIHKQDLQRDSDF